MAKTLFFTRGSTILREGDPVPSVLYKIVKGRVAVSKSKGTDQVEIDVYTAGSFIAEFALMDNDRPALIVEAIDDTEIQAFEVDRDWTPLWLQATPLVQDVAKDLVLKLRRSYERLKRLQYFERITYDHLKTGSLKSYHLKDILRLARILTLVGYRYREPQSDGTLKPVEREAFEDQVYQVLSRSSVRLQDFVQVMVKDKYLTMSDDQRHFERMNLDQLEGFADYLAGALLKNDPAIYLKPIDVKALKLLMSVRHAQIAGQQKSLAIDPILDHDQREIGIKFSEPEAIVYLTEEMGDDVTARACLAQLMQKKAIHRQSPTNPRDQNIVLYYSEAGSIAKYQESVIEFTRLV